MGTCMEWMDGITEEAKEEIAGIVSAEYLEAGKGVGEIMGYVAERLKGNISRSGLEDYVGIYIEFLDFGDLLRLRDELGAQWMVDSVNDVCVVLGILIRRAYGRYRAEGQSIGH